MVHKVELLTPLGFTAKCDEAGLPDFDGKTTMTLERMANYSGPICSVSATEGQTLNRSGLRFAMKKMTPGSEDCEWEDCLREVKLMRALKKVFISSAGKGC